MSQTPIYISELRQQDSRGKKTANLVLNLESKNSAKIQPPLKTSFRKRPENINVKLISRQNRQIIALSHLCHKQMFCRPLLSVVLFRKHTSEFTQQEGRKKRTAKRLCVTNVTGLLLGTFVVVFP